MQRMIAGGTAHIHFAYTPENNKGRMPAGAAACFLLAAASFVACFAAWAEAASSALLSVSQAVVEAVSQNRYHFCGRAHHETQLPWPQTQRSAAT